MVLNTARRGTWLITPSPPPPPEQQGELHRAALAEAKANLEALKASDTLVAALRSQLAEAKAHARKFSDEVIEKSLHIARRERDFSTLTAEVGRLKHIAAKAKAFATAYRQKSGDEIRDGDEQNAAMADLIRACEAAAPRPAG